MDYKITYGLLDEEYTKEVDSTSDYQAYLIASKTLYDLITFREYSKGAHMSIAHCTKENSDGSL